MAPMSSSKPRASSREAGRACREAVVCRRPTHQLVTQRSFSSPGAMTVCSPVDTVKSFTRQPGLVPEYRRFCRRPWCERGLGLAGRPLGFTSGSTKS